MKKSVSVRVLTALAGLVLLALGACMAAEAFFGVQITGAAGQLLASSHPAAVLGKLLAMIGLVALAVAAVICALPRRRKEQNDFVMQKGENGAIGISVRAIEKQVRACVAKHDVIADAEVSIRECREGLIILLNVDQVAGVNIPLSVGLLQRQIKQYVSGCTGVDVHEVRVMVENNTANVVASPFAVQDAVIPAARPMVEESRPAEAAPVHVVQEAPVPVAAEEAAEAPAQAPAPVAVAAPVVLPELPPMPEPLVEEDERPLHQRIFGAEEQPVFVPAPPEILAEAQPEPDEVSEENEAECDENAEELLIDADVNAPMDEVLPQEAAEAGAAYSEALWTDEISETDEEISAQETDETVEEPELLQ